MPFRRNLIAEEVRAQTHCSGLISEIEGRTFSLELCRCLIVWVSFYNMRTLSFEDSRTLWYLLASWRVGRPAVDSRTEPDHVACEVAQTRR